MVKRFLYGAAVAATLLGSGTVNVQAEELYVRNRAFKDAHFIGGTTYVPIDGFLKAVRLPFRLDGSTVVIGQGNSPSFRPSNGRVVASRNGERLELNGITRNGKVYFPAKALA